MPVVSAMTIRVYETLLLAELDRTLAKPEEHCINCGAPSDKPHCSPQCRLELWCARHNLSSDFNLWDAAE